MFPLVALLNSPAPTRQLPVRQSRGFAADESRCFYKLPPRRKNAALLASGDAESLMTEPAHVFFFFAHHRFLQAGVCLRQQQSYNPPSPPGPHSLQTSATSSTRRPSPTAGGLTLSLLLSLSASLEISFCPTKAFQRALTTAFQQTS